MSLILKLVEWRYEQLLKVFNFNNIPMFSRITNHINLSNKLVALKYISYDEKTKNNSIVYRAKFFEMVLVRMMNHCKVLISRLLDVQKQHTVKINSKYTIPEEINESNTCIEQHKKEISELIIGYNKIIIEKISNKQISKTCIADIMEWLEHAKKMINFDPVNVVIKYPQFIFKTAYDNMLENNQTGLYEYQREIFEFATKTPSYLALVHTMLGSGKTSMILPLCGYLMSKRKQIKTKLLFCCPNQIVLLEVAQMVYGMGVSFAIVVYNEESNRLAYKWSSFADKNNPAESAVLYLCDIFVTRILLEQRQNCLRDRDLYFQAHENDPINYPLLEHRIPSVPDYILIADELTKDADNQKGFMVDSGFSLTTEVFVNLMKISPSKIILMSATLPTVEQIPDFYKAILDSHHDMKLKSFSSAEAKIGCALISHQGEIYAPHIGSETIEDIKNVLQTIKTNPFIGRFYTIEVLLEMIATFNNLNIPVPDLAVMFHDPSQANQAMIQKIVYDMLMNLIEVKKLSNDINNLSMTNNQQFCEENNSINIIRQACTMNKMIRKSVDLNCIFTTDISRFNKGCLIFSSDPVKTGLEVYCANFDKFLNDRSDKNIFEQIRLDSILDKYEKNMNAFNKALDLVNNKKDASMSKQNKEKNKKENLVIEQWKTTAKMVEEQPKWTFPEELQLCSVKHLLKIKGDGSLISDTIEPSDLPLNSIVSENILMMLASGIGIYTTNSTLLDDEYLKTVLYLAKRGKIKFIFTDSSIAYGTNLSVSDIIIDDNKNDGESIIDKNSMKTIFQMLGRAGRGGNLSYEARIYTTSAENNLINMIRSYIKGTLDEGSKDEIRNIETAFNILWNTSNDNKLPTKVIERTKKTKKMFPKIYY